MSEANTAGDEKLLLLRMHPCAHGLSDQALEEIAEACESIDCHSGQMICRADERVHSVYLVIRGRLRLKLLDIHGNLILRRFETAGGIFGGLAAALADQDSVECLAEDPSMLLRIDYERALELTKKHDLFRTNYLRVVYSAIKQSLLRRKTVVRPRSAAFFHRTDDTRRISNQLMERLVALGEEVCVYTDRAVDVEAIHQRQVGENAASVSADDLRREVADWLHRGRAVFDMSTSCDPDYVLRALSAFDQVFWCVTNRNWAASLEQLQRIVDRVPTWRDKVSIVWMLEAGEKTPLECRMRDLAKRDFKVCFDPPEQNEGTASTLGIERLLHFMRGIQIGIALGGGAARGMAHLGVLRALERSGLAVDMISGTSAGAMTGTLYASGFDPDFLVERFVADLKPSWPFHLLPHGGHWYLMSKYRRGQFDPMLRKYLRDTHFRQLVIPMSAVALDLISGQAVIRESGDAVNAIVESINLPILSRPINRQGQALVDGGLIDNVPADVLAENGCNFVIAVSVTAKMEREFATNRPDTPAHKMRKASTIQTLLRSHLVQSHNLNAIGVRSADFVIEPDVTAFDLSEFTRTDELAEIGEQETLRMVPEIKRLLNRLDERLFPVS